MKVEKWRKISGKHHMVVGGEKRKYGPGQDDGDLVEFPLGGGPNPSDDSWEPVDVPQPEGPKFESGLTIKHRGGGYWDVINPETGEAINTKGLRKDDALALAELGLDDEDEVVDEDEDDVDDDDEDEDDEDDEE